MSRPHAVELFTQPHCAPCREVERFLQERGVAFVRRDVTADAAALELVVSRGFMATPVTRIGEHWVAGFRRQELERALDA
jgi:glutaredoxin-like protein NrdH